MATNKDRTLLLANSKLNLCFLQLLPPSIFVWLIYAQWAWTCQQIANILHRTEVKVVFPPTHAHTLARPGQAQSSDKR